jgi:spermidine/putrescine transport system substrate-binding protein
MADPAWDPGRKYTLPYAEGQVGIAYYPDEVGFEIKDVKDLLDPRIKGKVTILSEMRDSLGMFMLSEGIDPSTASVEEAKEALVLIEEARDKGQFRKITGNSYTDDLGARDAVAAIAWSGDVVALQAENPDLVWVAPEAGQVSFVDTMLIPANAVNAEQAHAWMNFLYDPTVSGPLFEFISYVSPVEGAADNMSDDARSNLLINPPADAKIVEFRTLTETEADDLENAFAQATQL